MSEIKQPTDEQEQGSFEIIASAGEARSLAYEALRAAKGGDFEKADELMQHSKDASLKAHNMQTEMLVQEAQGNHLPVDVLLVHAQDHLMTSMLAQELIAELIEVYKSLNDK